MENREKSNDIDITRENELFQRREKALPHMSYAHEKERHRVITEGRTDLLEAVLKIPPDGTNGTLSRNELRNAKNMFITAITLFTRAAIDGGLPEELAYAMSDSFIQNGEDLTTAEEVEKLYLRALQEFTHAVAEKGKRHYSPKIWETIHYIHIHLHEKITLEGASEAVGLSPCHLSRSFKSETGMSIVDAVQMERVEAARHMLIYSDYTLSAISQYLNFTNQSYFVKIFKKYIGMSPGTYRKAYRKMGSW